MAVLTLRREERIALIVALALHAGLVAVLVWQPAAPPPPLPERMTVTLTDQLGPVSTSPEPQADPAPDSGPEPGEAPPPPEPEPMASPEPAPRPSPVPVPKPALRPQPKPAPTKAAPKPTPTKAAAKPSPTKPTTKPGASEFEKVFGPGAPGATGKQPTKNPPAAAPSSQLVSSWSSSIGARVRGPWNACAVSGLDAEKLRVTVQFTLDRFGEVATMAEPVVTGMTEGNRPQVARFKECAVRAINTAAPFDYLPREYYDVWKSRRLVFRKE
jgi:outer membrane biosynthesis protein TonB